MPEQNELFDTITLTDENGEQTEFDILDVIEYEDNKYAVLLPADDDEADEVVILQVEEVSDEEDTLLPIEDEQILADVFEIFKDHASDVFDFDD